MVTFYQRNRLFLQSHNISTKYWHTKIFTDKTGPCKYCIYHAPLIGSELVTETIQDLMGPIATSIMNCAIRKSLVCHEGNGNGCHRIMKYLFDYSSKAYPINVSRVVELFVRVWYTYRFADTTEWFSNTLDKYMENLMKDEISVIWCFCQFHPVTCTTSQSRIFPRKKYIHIYIYMCNVYTYTQIHIYMESIMNKVDILDILTSDNHI